MTINKPTEPKILDPLLGVSRETLHDPCGGDGGGGGKRWMRDWSEGRARRTVARRQMRDGTRRGSTRRNMEKDKLRVESRSIEGQTDEEQVIWRRNTRDGTWRRSGGAPPGPAVTTFWRPWDAQEHPEPVQTIVSIANPDNFNQPVYFVSTDIRTRSDLYKGKLSAIVR